MIPAYLSMFRRLQSLRPSSSPEDIARSILAGQPKLALAVIETVGLYPASEPEIRALQKVYK